MDLTKHLACAHATALDLRVVEGSLRTPVIQDDQLELVFQLGLTHERAYLELLRGEGRSVAEIPSIARGSDPLEAEAATLEAMQSGFDVVYQATFFDGIWGGKADFLLKVDRPSRLGPWSYEIADTKLARRLKVPALLQMASYASRLGVLQGVEPEGVYVVAGDGRSHRWRLADVSAFARRARSRLEEAVETGERTEPAPVTHCGQCRWIAHCAGYWKRTDDLSLVAFMRHDHRRALIDAGISTLEELGSLSSSELPATIGAGSRDRLVQQARQQLDERRTGVPSYTLLPPVEATGLLRLPEPDIGDLYLDFEGDPYADAGEGREYLAGIGDRDGNFLPLWAHSRDEEPVLTEQLVDNLLDHWASFPDMHVYHYAPYETSALKRLTARHGVREAELDRLLRAERFVDLYAVVRQAMRISKSSYSIKKIEAYYWGQVRSENEDVADALASVVAYERWLAEGDETILSQIAAYNRDDVLSTKDLHGWLELRRTELEETHGLQQRPPASPNDPSTPLSPEEVYEQQLAERLRATGQPILAGLVQWHRREARPAWWEVFRLGDLDDDELIDDSSAIGGLSEPIAIGRFARSALYEYHFPPQDTKVRVGEFALDVDRHGPAGTVFELDALEGRVVLKKMGDPVAARALGPAPPVSDKVLRHSVHATAEAVLDGKRPLGLALIERLVPPDTAVRYGEPPEEAVLRVGRNLSGEVLAVQGPPGSGKTTVGASLIRSLLDSGKSVGVTATSHTVIGNLIRSVARQALQKCPEDERVPSDHVEYTDDNAEVVSAILSSRARLVGGTSWLWSRSDMENAVDVLVVDEAGQFSLTNAVAVSRGARAIVLLGDPQQLEQPTRAVHPPGVGVSALEHLLDGHDTVPPNRGIFLNTSWRMHPDIAAFVSDLAYEGRLHSGPDRDRQSVGFDGELSGTGLRTIFVEHDGNAAASPEEADAVRKAWSELQGETFVHHDGSLHQIGTSDVLVVAPYNNQVAQIAGQLPAGARVGTVDKFQGQEAPVVIYSMTSSSAEDAPRGTAFLYDLHRLNVAVSRAKALAIVVMSPRLLDAAVTLPEQLRRVNALCRLAEVATTVDLP